MAWDEVLAAILGGLEGGVGSWQGIKKGQQQERDRKALQDRQARLDANAEEDRLWRIEDRDLRLRDRARTETDQLLTSIGRSGLLTDEQVAGARDVGLGHRVEEAPDFQHSYFTQAGPVPLMVPEVMSRVAPTAAERKADQVAAEKKRADDAARAELEKAIKGLPQHLQPSAQFGVASGKMPTLGAADFVSPEQRTEQEIARETAKAKALLPIKLRERESEKAIDRRFATMPIPTRDDPAMPQGVRAYLGDLVSRYQSDPAGARAELQRAAPNLLRDHPNLDLLKVTQQMNAMLPLPQLTDAEKEAAATERMAAAQARQTPGSSASIPAAVPKSAPPPVPAAGTPRTISRAKLAAMAQKYKTNPAQLEAQARAEGYAVVP